MASYSLTMTVQCSLWNKLHNHTPMTNTDSVRRYPQIDDRTNGDAKDEEARVCNDVLILGKDYKGKPNRKNKKGGGGRD